MRPAGPAASVCCRSGQPYINSTVANEEARVSDLEVRAGLVGLQQAQQRSLAAAAWQQGITFSLTAVIAGLVSVTSKFAVRCVKLCAINGGEQHHNDQSLWALLRLLH